MSDSNVLPASAPEQGGEEISQDTVSAVEALLRGEAPKPKPAPEKPAPEAKPEPKAETPPATPEPGREAKTDEQSETTEAAPEPVSPEAEKFYAQEVKLSNGRTTTVGELKDLAQQYDAKELSLIERETAVVKQHDELQQVAQYLNLPEGVRAMIERQQHDYLVGQHSAMLQAIPEWRDQAAFEKGRQAIHDLGAEYGVDLSRVSDHKVVKMLHDYARLRAAVKNARENVKQVRSPEPKAKPNPLNGRSSDVNKAIATAKQTGSQADQVRAVDMLIRG